MIPPLLACKIQSYLQNEIQNESLYFVRYGQLKSVIGNFRKEATYGFIRFKEAKREVCSQQPQNSTVSTVHSFFFGTLISIALSTTAKFHSFHSSQFFFGTPHHLTVSTTGQQGLSNGRL